MFERAREMAMLGRALALAAAMMLSAAAAQQPALYQGFDVQVTHAPVAATYPDGARLVHELRLTNFARDALQLMRVEVLDAESGAVLASYEGADLDAAIGNPAASGRAANPRDIGSGAHALLYLNSPVEGARGPASIAHRIAFERARDRAQVTILGGEARVDRRRLPTLGPPLRGGPWVAVHHPSWERGHRRVFYAVDGRARLPGRFAIDWMWAGGGDGRGAEVLAVADAVVAAMRNDFPDAGGGPPVTLANATGNYVALDLGRGRYAFYEHLAQDVRVRVGQRVRRGQVIGTLGASGSVTEPHLHFHVADANAHLAAEGLPYLLRDYTPLGAYSSIEAFRAGAPWGEAPGSQTPSLPSPMLVVRFPE
jgi:murein DD-endopeptidase MepM/ murein hydrolase activator NlpD